MIIKRITTQSDLTEICSQLAPEKWGSDNDMASYQPNTLKEFLADDKHLLVVGYEGTQIVCSALGYHMPHPDKSRRSLYIDEIDTHPDFRQKGYGSEMIQWLRGYVVEHDLNEVWLTTELEDNDVANSFYESLDPAESLKCMLYSYKAQSE